LRAGNFSGPAEAYFSRAVRVCSSGKPSLSENFYRAAKIFNVRLKHASSPEKFTTTGRNSLLQNLAMKLLLHICCAPCGIYPLRRLRQEDFAVSAFFYNPNIHPQEEYLRRRQAVERWAKEEKCPLIAPAYRPEEFFQALGKEEAMPQRCFLCWRLRLGRTACVAQEGGFRQFSTALLASPYQDQEKIKQIGKDLSLAGKGEAEFYYADFRPGFRQAHDEARLQGIYCQKYCGCTYSQLTRCRKSARP
jgi:predicted adenine nucleotide alpha hydrolase (AANH) superfamily ATPase